MSPADNVLPRPIVCTIHPLSFCRTVADSDRGLKSLCRATLATFTNVATAFTASICFSVVSLSCSLHNPPRI